MLLEVGLASKDIAIISPYNAQVNLLKRALAKQYPDLEIGSVDGFQGREKEAILISLVRSNSQHEVGFLSENRRTNVALTRARRNLVVIGDSETVSSNPFLKRMIDFFQQHGEVRSAHEYLSGTLGEISVSSITLNEKYTKGDQTPKKSELSAPQEHLIKKKKKTKPQIESNEVTNTASPKFGTEMNQTGSLLPTKTRVETDSKSELEKQIEVFLQDESQEFLNFPSNLNSFERMVVHELAEKFNLNHISKGEGKERYIQVSKKVEKEEEEEEIEEEIEEEKKEEKKQEKSLKSNPKPDLKKKKKKPESKPTNSINSPQPADLLLNEAIEK